jgi:hypothetical protein
MIQNFHGHVGDVFALDVPRSDTSNIFISGVSFMNFPDLNLFKFRLFRERISTRWFGTCAPVNAFKVSKDTKRILTPYDFIRVAMRLRPVLTTLR